MEVSNLMALDNVEELVDFLKLYSSNDEGRHSMIVQLLLATNPFFIKELKAPSKDSKDNIRKILDEYLLCLGIELDK
ncbi:MAG: hypothetical protein WC175_03050 [Candidatus Dojkabacteria bacterium]